MVERSYVTVGELAEYLKCPMLGDKDKQLYGLSLYQYSKDNMLTYVPGDMIHAIKDIQAGAILTRPSIGLQLHRNYIITPNDPYLCLIDTIQFFIDKGIYCVPSKQAPDISKTADISNYVVIGNGSSIDDDTVLMSGVVIGENVKIGKNCTIGANTVIGNNTVIEDNVVIGCCCSIGTENFEFCKYEKVWKKIPPVGNVIIHHHAYICGNVVIERGTIGTTEIGAYTQIDNLVQIGHEAKVGEHSHIVACVAIAGWAEIGSYVDIYGQAAVSNHVKVGDNTILLARAGVDKSIDDGMVVSGFPAQNHKDELRFQAFLRRMYRKIKKG